MTISRPCTADDYLLSFWTRQLNKGGWKDPMPPPNKRKEILLANWLYKFPFGGAREAIWQVCRVSRVGELENLWMHKSDDWLEKRRLWRGSHLLGDLAKTAIETGFWKRPKQPGDGSAWGNYGRWSNTELLGRLDEHDKPMLIEEDNHIDILDGFGRLLPYLALVYEGKQFSSFEAYLAR